MHYTIYIHSMGGGGISLHYTTGTNIKFDWKPHVLQTLLNRIGHMFGWKPRCRYPGRFITFTERSLPPLSDATEADPIVWYRLNVRSLSAQSGCKTCCFRFLNAAAFARYPLSYILRKGITFTLICPLSFVYSAKSSL